MNEFLLDPMIITQNTSGLRFDDVVAAARAQAAAYRKMNTVNILADGGPTRPDYAAMAKVVTNRNKDKNFVQRALNPDKYPHLTDDKGNDVTHLMTWSDNGESMDIYPTVVYDNGKLKQLDDDEAFEYAIRNNERINIPISDFGDWYSQNGLIEHKEFAKGGGLSRSKDYGSKKKPYPSVKSGDFAGGGRSYPIPTKADAVDALRLAGLHHRADVKAKVYRKYPSLKHAEGGKLFNWRPPEDFIQTTYNDTSYIQPSDNTSTNVRTETLQAEKAKKVQQEIDKREHLESMRIRPVPQQRIDDVEAGNYMKDFMAMPAVDRMNKAVYDITRTSMALGLPAALITNPVGTVAALGTGIAGGYGVDKGTQWLSNNKYPTFANWLSNTTNGKIWEENAELLNPGLFIGGGAGSRVTKIPWRPWIPKDKNMAYRIMGPLERDWLLQGNELSTRATNALTEAEEVAARAKAKRFNIFKAGAEHGGRKQFSKGQPWRGTTVTHGEPQVLAIPGEGLPWVSGRHYHGPQGSGRGIGSLNFQDAPIGSHIDLQADPSGYTGINPSLLEGSKIYSPVNLFGLKLGYKVNKFNTPNIEQEVIFEKRLKALEDEIKNKTPDETNNLLGVNHLISEDNLLKVIQNNGLTAAPSMAISKFGRNGLINTNSNFVSPHHTSVSLYFEPSILNDNGYYWLADGMWPTRSDVIKKVGSIANLDAILKAKNEIYNELIKNPDFKYKPISKEESINAARKHDGMYSEYTPNTIFNLGLAKHAITNSTNPIILEWFKNNNINTNFDKFLQDSSIKFKYGGKLYR